MTFKTIKFLYEQYRSGYHAFNELDARLVTSSYDINRKLENTINAANSWIFYISDNNNLTDWDKFYLTILKIHEIENKRKNS